MKWVEVTGFETRKQKADEYLGECIRIIATMPQHFPAGPVQISVKNRDGSDDDRLEAGDILVVSNASAECLVSVRTRLPKSWSWLTFTMRYQTRTGSHETEFAKLQRGCKSRFYFYSWAHQTNPAPSIGRWIFVDNEKLRTSGLLEQAKLMDLRPYIQEPWMELEVWQLDRAGVILERSQEGWL